MHGEQKLSELETLIKNYEIQVESSTFLFEKKTLVRICAKSRKLSNRRL